MLWQNILFTWYKNCLTNFLHTTYKTVHKYQTSKIRHKSCTVLVAHIKCCHSKWPKPNQHRTYSTGTQYLSLELTIILHFVHNVFYILSRNLEYIYVNQTQITTLRDFCVKFFFHPSHISIKICKLIAVSWFFIHFTFKTFWGRRFFFF